MKLDTGHNFFKLKSNFDRWQQRHVSLSCNNKVLLITAICKPNYIIYIKSLGA